MQKEKAEQSVIFIKQNSYSFKVQGVAEEGDPKAKATGNNSPN